MDGPAPIPLAFVCGVLRPYRLHFHQRIVREMPEVELHTLVTHERATVPTPNLFVPEIRPVGFGAGQAADRQGKLRWQACSWAKGGRLIRWLCDHHIRAVVVVGYADAALLRVLRWCHRHDIPCLLWADSNGRGRRVASALTLGKRAVLARVISWSSAILVCGRLGREYFAAFGADPQRIFFVPYEPDYEPLEQLAPAQVAAIGARYGLAPGRRRFIYSGRFIRRKRVDLLLDAFCQLAGVRPEWDLVLMGAGPEQRALAGRIPAALQARVFWLPFFAEPATVAGVYRHGDVLVVPSEYEPWGVVVNEGLAAGLAIVASDVVGAAYELVVPGINGELFRSQDGGDLQRRLKQVSDPGRIDGQRAGSAGVLSAWRESADPVTGLRRALMSAGVL